MSLSPHCETYCSRIRRSIVRNFQVKIWSFLQSKSVNNVCKLLQLPGVHPLNLLPWLCRWTLLGTDPLGCSPQMKIHGTDTALPPDHGLSTLDPARSKVPYPHYRLSPHSAWPQLLPGSLCLCLIPGIAYAGVHNIFPSTFCECH